LLAELRAVGRAVELGTRIAERGWLNVHCGGMVLLRAHFIF